MRMRNLVLIVVALLVVTIVIGACGSSPTATPVPAPTKAPAATVAPTKAPAANTPAASSGTPPAIPHDLAGRDQCLTCHGPSGVKPAPASHASYSNTMCQNCHKPR
jgi:hypothetical protein